MTDQQTNVDEPGWGLGKTRAVPTWRLPAVMERIEKVNRKAAKLSVPAFTVDVSAPYLVQAHKHPDAVDSTDFKYVETVDVTIAGAPVQVSGFRFLGRVDFEDGMVIVNTLPGEQIPPRYRTTTPYCDHCASQRQRNNVFVFRREGDSQHVQVGRSCLKDFMGHDPAQVLHSVSLWLDLAEDLDGDERASNGHQVYVVEVDAVLAMTAAVVAARAGAFVSRAQERTSAEWKTPLIATASLVSEQLFAPPQPPRGWVRITPSEDDIQRAAEAKAWALASMTKSDQSDYEYNLTALLQQEVVQAKRIGLLASLIGVYARHLGQVAERAKRVDAHVGQIGQRREFAATYAGCSSFDTDYGTCYIGRFETPEGLLVYKGGSPFWPSGIKAGEEIAFTATIKDHADYKGAKQTLIQRAKVKQPAALAA